jgi:hypothetical protein
MAKAFAHIHARSTEIRRQKNFLRGMIKRMLHLKQSAAWEKWQAEALHGRDQKERVRLALARMLNRKLSMAFEQWQTEAEQMKAEETALRQALMRMIAARMAAAWGTWRAMAAEAKRTAHAAGGAVRRMLNRKLSAAFELWQSVHIECVMLQAREEQAIHEMGEFNKGLHFSYWVRWRGGDDSWEEYREAIGKAGKDRREEIVTKRNQQKRAAREHREAISEDSQLELAFKENRALKEELQELKRYR